METQTQLPMMKVAVKKGWKDGSIDFSQWGYSSTWFPGRWRLLPEDIVRRCEQSGAEITAPPVGSREDFLRRAPDDHADHTVQVPQEEKEQAASKAMAKEARVRVLFPKGFRDGTLTAEFAALGHPPTFGVNEIFELPLSLFEALERTGAPMSRDKDMLKEYDGQQLKHIRRAEAWQREHQEQKELLAESKANAAANAETWAKINNLSERVIKLPPGKAREALWIRIEELHTRLK